MTKEELTDIVDLVAGNWNLVLEGLHEQTVYKAWWRYLRDLEKVDVLAIIDEMALSNTMTPRPGDVRVRTLNRVRGYPRILTPEEAWETAEHLWGQTSMGIEGETPDELVGAVMRQNIMERRAFMDAYKVQAENYTREKYAVVNDEA